MIDIPKRFIFLFYIAQCVMLKVSEIRPFWHLYGDGKNLMTANNMQAHSFEIDHTSKMSEIMRWGIISYDHYYA